MRQLTPQVYSVGAIDWDRRVFDELIPLPQGTTYNCYLVRGTEKTALLDTVEPSMVNVLIDNLVRAGVDRLDYVVAHHAEQDHSGSIPDVLLLYPEAKVVANAKCRDMLMDLLEISAESFVTVEEGERLSLGDKTLRFVNIPWVHWPETMGTYLEEDGIFFSCDFFGSHLATSSLFVEDDANIYSAAKRYYAEIMMPFRAAIRKNIEKVRGFEIEMIAPSHGPVHDKPESIIKAYEDWIGETVKNSVVIPFISMHESTRKMVDYLTSALMERGISVAPFNMAAADIGEMAMALVDAATVVLGSPTVLTSAHPKVAYAATLANTLRPKTRFLSVIGSYGWGGRMAEQLASLMPNIKAEMLETVLVKGRPGENDFAALDALADRILEKHTEIGITEQQAPLREAESGRRV